MGVNRIQELLHYSKNIKTPQMIVYFKDPWSKDRNALNKVASYFTHLSIRQLSSTAEIYYDLGLNEMSIGFYDLQLKQLFKLFKLSL